MKFSKVLSLFIISLVLTSCGIHKEVNQNLEQNEKIVSHSAIQEKESFYVDISKDKKSGYPYMNSDHCIRTICKDGDSLYVAEDKGWGSVLYRCDGKKKVIYKSKYGRIRYLNVQNGWIVFQLLERKGKNRQIDDSTIVRLRSDGSDVKKFDVKVEDLWLYDNRIYYSWFTKWGGSDIESMDINGKDNKTIVEKDRGIYFYVINDKIYMIYNKDTSCESDNTCDLYEMNLDGSDQKQIAEFKAYEDSVCLQENSIYYIKPNDNGEKEYLYQFKCDEKSERPLTSTEVSKYFFCDNYIYYQVNYWDGIKRLNLTDGQKKWITKEGISTMEQFDIILDQKIFYSCDDGILPYIDCDTGKEKKEILK